MLRPLRGAAAIAIIATGTILSLNSFVNENAEVTQPKGKSGAASSEDDSSLQIDWSQGWLHRKLAASRPRQPAIDENIAAARHQIKNGGPLPPRLESQRQALAKEYWKDPPRGVTRRRRLYNEAEALHKPIILPWQRHKDGRRAASSSDSSVTIRPGFDSSKGVPKNPKPFDAELGEPGTRITINPAHKTKLH